MIALPGRRADRERRPTAPPSAPAAAPGCPRRSSAWTSRPSVDTHISSELASSSRRRSTRVGDRAAPQPEDQQRHQRRPRRAGRPRTSDRVSAYICTGTATAVNWKPKHRHARCRATAAGTPACRSGRTSIAQRRAGPRGRASCDRRHGASRSTIQSPVVASAEAQPVVQPAGPALPELHRLRAGPAARPSAAAAGPARRREPLGRRPASASSSAARSGTTCDCGLAQAPSWEPRGRVAKYASVSARSTRSTRPGDDHLPLHREPREDQAARTGCRPASAPLRDA